jgi:hypothetical protein
LFWPAAPSEGDRGKAVTGIPYANSQQDRPLSFMLDRKLHTATKAWQSAVSSENHYYITLFSRAYNDANLEVDKPQIFGIWYA